MSLSCMNYVPIAELHPNSANVNVIGVIIGKTDIRGFPDRKNIGHERYTFSFTLKDSPEDFINVSGWGQEAYIRRLAGSFRIGDCVIIENPLITTKDSEKEDKFCPSTTRLLVTENHSGIRVVSDAELEPGFLYLCQIPVKDHRDFYSLGDIVANGQSLNGTVINILAVVQSVGEQRHFTTADGRKGQRCEVKLFDETVTSFSLTSWDCETTQFAQTWIPRETVLFIADARVTFDTFRQTMVATVTSKTIITVNPDTKEASLLFSYARELSDSGILDNQDKLSGENVSLDSISDVFTVNALKRAVLDNSDKQEGIYAIIYAFITTLNLDSSLSRVIRSRCTKCKFVVTEGQDNCTNPGCPQDRQLDVSTGFDLLVDISDHTGTLQSCLLVGAVAEQTLGCTPQEFVCLTEVQKTALRWKFLLERCKIYVKVVPSPKARGGFRGNLLSCTLADPVEVRESLRKTS